MKPRIIRLTYLWVLSTICACCQHPVVLRKPWYAWEPASEKNESATAEANQVLTKAVAFAGWVRIEERWTGSFTMSSPEKNYEFSPMILARTGGVWHPGVLVGGGSTFTTGRPGGATLTFEVVVVNHDEEHDYNPIVPIRGVLSMEKTCIESLQRLIGARVRVEDCVVSRLELLVTSTHGQIANCRIKLLLRKNDSAECSAEDDVGVAVVWQDDEIQIGFIDQ